MSGVQKGHAQSIRQIEGAIIIGVATKPIETVQRVQQGIERRSVLLPIASPFGDALPIAGFFFL